MLWRSDQHAIGAADAKIDLRFAADEIRRAYPALDVFGLGPERKQCGSRHVESARDQQFVVGDLDVHLRFSFRFSSAI